MRLSWRRCSWRSTSKGPSAHAGKRHQLALPFPVLGRMKADGVFKHRHQQHNLSAFDTLTRKPATALHHRTYRARAACRPQSHRHPARSRYLLTNHAPSHRRPRRSICGVPPSGVSNPARSMRPKPFLRASCPAEGLARCASGLEPRSSFACPRPATSPLRACPPPRAIRLRAVVGLRRSAPFAFAQARASATAFPRWPCASRAPLLGSSHARAACGCPSGQRGRYVTHPAAGAFCERCVFALIHSRVWRSAHGRRGPPRCARTTPRPAPANAFALLSPPRETSRSICLPIARSGAARLPPSCRSRRLAPSSSPAARLRRGMARVARAGQGARALAAAPSQLPGLGGNWLRAALARCRGWAQERYCNDAGLRLRTGSNHSHVFAELP